MYAEMERIGAGTQLQSITVEGQKLELERRLSDEEKNLASTQHSEAALREQRKIYIDQRHRDNLTALVGVKVQLAQAESDLAKATKLGELSSLVSPVDAIVVTVPSISAGGVVVEAEPMFSLVATDDPLEADVQIDSKDSGFVKKGDLANIKFDAYKFLEHGMAEGRVKTISEESFTQTSSQDVVTTAAGASAPEKRTPYFAARIVITAVKLHDVPPDFRLVPGMTLQADIVVGRRTIMWYLLGGALRSGSEAMHEP
jgi:HlyD family type I secretion membrane fusion protein